MRKKEVKSSKADKRIHSRMFTLAFVSFFLIVSMFSFLLIQEPTITGWTHKEGHNPPGGGGGGGETTTTTTTTGGGSLLPIKVIFQQPHDGDTLKRGTYTLLVQGFEGANTNSDLQITATSELFGTKTLTHNFEAHGNGIYGINFTIKENVAVGQYAITVRGQRSSVFDEETILVKVDPLIRFNLSLEKEYEKGQEIKFLGRGAYFDGTPASNVSYTLKVTAPDFSFNRTGRTQLNGGFAEYFLISYAEPEGEWKTEMILQDKNDNEGKVTTISQVIIPKGIAFYTVTFLSPARDTTFLRDTSVPISIEVTEKNLPVSNATVEFRTPRGNFLLLQEIRPGTYSEIYYLEHDEPLGPWSVSVQAKKTVDSIFRAGGYRIPVLVEPEIIKAVLLEPRAENFFTGIPATFRLQLKYANDAPVTEAVASILLGEKLIHLQETEEAGIYNLNYLFSSEDVNVETLTAQAEDVYGNAVLLPQKIISVKKLGPYELKARLFYYNIFLRYWYAFAGGLVALIVITSPFWLYIIRKVRLRKTTRKQRQLIEIQKDIQRKYFKHHRMSGEEYHTLMMKYRERDEALRELRMKLEKKVK